jgi:tetratricopeptide (TPR) repeat protein
MIGSSPAYPSRTNKGNRAMAEIPTLKDISLAPDGGTSHLAGYDRYRALGQMPAARQALLDSLAGGPERAWLECARALVLRRDVETATAILTAAMDAYPGSTEVRYALAGSYRQNGRPKQAEALLRELLAKHPDHVAATFLLARLLKDEGRMSAAARGMRALFDRGRQDLGTVIQAVELLDDCNRKQDAAAICEAEIAAGSVDSRVHVHAAMLLSQLGRFELARQRHMFALSHSEQALDWNIPLGLAGLQRYQDASHPDFALFRDSLQRPDLSEKAHASLLFALGKAHDDIADYAQAAGYLRQANAIAHTTTAWSRKRWRQRIEARIAGKPASFRLTPPADWTPLFIVGMPRSGTTLLAELLSRHPDVCNRGELAWLPSLAQQLATIDDSDRAAYERAASTYAAQLRQDDSEAHWFIDKQPHNFLHVELILTLFPNARIIHCQRNTRDNALSLWATSFISDVQDFSYDFADIAAAIRGCRRLMAHWQARYPESIRTVRYEQLSSEPATCIASLTAWLGLSEQDLLGARSQTTSISTASLWQARQPIYTRSVERWRNYAPYVPELLRLPAD